ncbi:YpmS family protein [Alteribacillus sp. HJP-4]|uniref:YpmS family protein n=1 Tax=Alteribacillus sp. HJP-4 TaxID=2775394 RepID=UPI0035CCD3E7
MTNQITMHRKWKWLFISLAAINVGVIIYLMLLFNASPAEPMFPTEEDAVETDVEFSISSDKNNLNHLIDRYISQLSTKGNSNYTVELNNKVKLEGSMKAFDQQIPATVILEPKVQENGDLILEQESISLGQLQLPNRNVLQYIKSNYEMPDWIEVNPDRENIYVSVTEISSKPNIQVKAEEFDLKNDRISFSVHTTYESLPFNERKIMNYFQ